MPTDHAEQRFGTPHRLSIGIERRKVVQKEVVALGKIDNAGNHINNRCIG